MVCIIFGWMLLLIDIKKTIREPHLSVRILVFFHYNGIILPLCIFVSMHFCLTVLMSYFRTGNSKMIWQKTQQTWAAKKNDVMPGEPEET